MKVPRRSPITIATPVGILPYTADIAVRTLTTDMIDPTLRSIPPEISTTVMPTDTIAKIEICLKIVIKLLTLKNCGERNENTIIMATSTKTTADSLMIFLTLILFSLLAPICCPSYRVILEAFSIIASCEKYSLSISPCCTPS